MEIGEESLSTYKFSIQMDLEDLSAHEYVEDLHEKFEELDEVYDIVRKYDELEDYLNFKEKKLKEELEETELDNHRFMIMGSINQIRTIRKIMGVEEDKQWR